MECLTKWPPAGEEEEPSAVRKRKTERDETGSAKKSRRHFTLVLYWPRVKETVKWTLRRRRRSCYPVPLLFPSPPS